MCCDVEWFGKVSWLMIRCVLWLVGEIQVGRYGLTQDEVLVPAPR